MANRDQLVPDVFGEWTRRQVLACGVGAALGLNLGGLWRAQASQPTGSTGVGLEENRALAGGSPLRLVLDTDPVRTFGEAAKDRLPHGSI